MSSIKAQVELFHLLFIQQLSRQLDKNLYAIKGGCNLRFFFKCIRYSEDLDLDIHVVSKETLQNKVNKILSSQTLRSILKSKQITISAISTPKQTHTTQRWKVELQTANPLPINTKNRVFQKKDGSWY